MAIKNIHEWSLDTSTSLSRYYMPNVPTPHEVISVLNDAGVSFVLVGLHGIGGWMNDPRATQDVDVIVATKHQKKAMNALLAAFTHLKAEDLPVVTRFRDPETGKVVIDAMKPNQQLFREVFKNTKTVSMGGQSHRIPSLEMALAMKFAPMVSLHRQEEDKFQDAHDFISMIKANPNIDLEKLAALGDLVYPEGGKEIVEKVRQVRAGERLRL